MEAELFLIRYGINQAVQVQNVKNIIVITDVIQHFLLLLHTLLLTI